MDCSVSKVNNDTQLQPRFLQIPLRLVVIFPRDYPLRFQFKKNLIVNNEIRNVATVSDNLFSFICNFISYEFSLQKVSILFFLGVHSKLIVNNKA